MLKEGNNYTLIDGMCCNDERIEAPLNIQKKLPVTQIETTRDMFKRIRAEETAIAKEEISKKLKTKKNYGTNNKSQVKDT